MKYNLPVDYTKLTTKQRREVREQYTKEQNGKCMYCNSLLTESPTVGVDQATFGFDWNDGKLLIKPSDSLCRVNADDQEKVKLLSREIYLKDRKISELKKELEFWLCIGDKKLNNCNTPPLIQATKDVANLYIARFSGVTEIEYEIEMMRKIVENNWPVDKMNRWLGFAQAGVIAKGFTTIDAERDLTRPYFHSAYQAEGLEAPCSVSVRNPPMVNSMDFIENICEGDVFYYIDCSMAIEMSVWTGSDEDYKKVLLGNVFLTVEAAENEIDRKHAIFQE